MVKIKSEKKKVKKNYHVATSEAQLASRSTEHREILSDVLIYRK